MPILAFCWSLPLGISHFDQAAGGSDQLTVWATPKFDKAQVVVSKPRVWVGCISKLKFLLFSKPLAVMEPAIIIMMAHGRVPWYPQSSQ